MKHSKIISVENLFLTVNKCYILHGAAKTSPRRKINELNVGALKKREHCNVMDI